MSASYIIIQDCIIIIIAIHIFAELSAREWLQWLIWQYLFKLTKSLGSLRDVMGKGVLSLLAALSLLLIGPGYAPSVVCPEEQRNPGVFVKGKNFSYFIHGLAG